MPTRGQEQRQLNFVLYYKIFSVSYDATDHAAASMTTAITGGVSSRPQYVAGSATGLVVQ